MPNGKDNEPMYCVVDVVGKLKDDAKFTDWNI